MAEASKIRLVRCPKCRNLLPEPPDHSVYECGGCGTVLRAKKRASISDGYLGNFDKEKNVEGGSCSLSETERESDRLDICSEKEDRVCVQGNVDAVSISSSRSEKKEFLIGDDDVNVGEKIKGLGLGQSNFEREIRYVDNSRPSSKHPIDVGVVGDDQDTNLNRSKSVNSSAVKGTGEVSEQFKSSAKVTKSGVIMNKWGLEREGFWGSDGGPRAVAEHGRFSPFAYSDEGSSDSLYVRGKPMKNFSYPDGLNGVESLGLNKAELHSKLHDLKEQISRLVEKPRERIVDERKMSPSESDRDSVAYNDSMQPFARRNRVPKPRNFSFSHGPAPSKNGHNLERRNFYPPPRHDPNVIPGSNHADPFWSQMLRRPHNQLPTHYPQQLPLDYCSGRCMDFDQPFLASHPREPFLRQPACSCSHCCIEKWQIPPEVSGTNFSNRRFIKEPMGSNFYHHVTPVEFDPMNHEPLGSIPPPFHSQGPQLHKRWPIDTDSDVDGFFQSRPRRVVVAHGNRRLSHPIAGGAPFMICCNCSELLKLPRKAMTNNLKKLQCGACSTLYSFEIKNKRLILSVPAKTKKVSCEADDGSRDLLNGGILSSLSGSTTGGMNSCSVDFDSDNNFQSSDTKQNIHLEDQMSNSSMSEKRQGHPSSSSISKEVEKSQDSVFIQRDVSNSCQLPLKDDRPLRVVDLPFRDHFDDSASVHAASNSEIESKSKWTDRERIILNKIASKHNSENDASTENEVEVSFSEYLNTSLFHSSVEASKEDQLSVNKGHKSFWVGVIKRSFRDFSSSTQSTKSRRPNVLVNGQQIPERLVKKAEKLAGPIEPGDYWYDFRAGFWGVMGQTCLGIITPYIEEFNYPMPENCAAGNTGVFVNGRELHKIDLDLLASRGLPVTKNKKYVVESSGRVLDEDSGEELDCLGKLAPTVEKIKCGFGMRPPKVAS